MGFDFERFKREINLLDYADRRFGYALDTRKSTVRSRHKLMRKDGDKVLIYHFRGKWGFKSVVDDGDRGSIIDFVRHRTGQSVSAIAQELQAWLEGASPSSLALPAVYTPAVSTPDRKRIAYLAQWVNTDTTAPYLTHERKIPFHILQSPLFTGTIGQNRSGQTVFPYQDLTGLCGLEYVDASGKNFAKGSAKGLWISNRRRSEARLVITETVIDALSYHALFEPSDPLYCAIGGRPSPAQLPLIAALLKSMATPVEAILAVDHDAGGETIINDIRPALAGSSCALRVHQPERQGEDWNEVLQRRTFPPP